MKLYYHNDSSKPVTPVTFNQEEDFVSYLGDEKLVVKPGEVVREGGKAGGEGGRKGREGSTVIHIFFTSFISPLLGASQISPRL